MRKPPKAVKDTYSPPRELPASVVRWIDSREAQMMISAALDATAYSNAEYDKASVVSRKSLDRPLSFI